VRTVIANTDIIGKTGWQLLLFERCSVRTPVVIILVAAVAASLAGCSPSAPTAGPDGCVATAAGSASDSVKVSGDFDAKPTIDFAQPLSATVTERTVVIAGDPSKPVAGVNDMAEIDLTLYNATTGSLVTSTEYSGTGRAEFYMNESVMLPGIVKTLQCAPVGTRVVGVIPPADAFGDAGSSNYSISADDSLVFVADVVSITHGYATGVDQSPTDGLPTVTLNDKHEPTITIPSTDPPAELQIDVLKKGDGDVVGDGDTVTVQYYGIDWNTGTVFDQSWANAGPTSFATTGVVDGFGQALVGQATGSQVLVVIPPELGYGPQGGNEGAGIAATDTIVFVIDILKTAPTP
jgi:FKBP-type peptidyl-prolyl cis-trans isomerase